MKNILILINIATAFVIIVFILIQGKGAGLGSAWGGGGEMYQTRRGIEKVTMKLTVLMIVVFFVVSVVNFFVK